MFLSDSFVQMLITMCKSKLIRYVILYLQLQILLFCLAISVITIPYFINV